MKYLRVYEATTTQELTMIKVAFNKYGVGYRTQFEHTLQMCDQLALGDHGAWWEVAESDIFIAKGILRELGIDLDYDRALDRFDFITKLDQISERIPLLGKLPLSYRFLILLFLVSSLPFILLILNEL